MLLYSIYLSIFFDSRGLTAAFQNVVLVAHNLYIDVYFFPTKHVIHPASSFYELESHTEWLSVKGVLKNQMDGDQSSYPGVLVMVSMKINPRYKWGYSSAKTRQNFLWGLERCSSGNK